MFGGLGDPCNSCICFICVKTHSLGTQCAHIYEKPSHRRKKKQFTALPAKTGEGSNAGNYSGKLLVNGK
jgi:hypothetical protein